MASPVATMLGMEVGQLAAADVRRATFFEARGIDYCCGGKQTLAAAAAGGKLTPAELAEELAAFDRAQGESQATDLGAMSIKQLIDMLLSVHHPYTYEALKTQRGRINKVVRAHGSTNGWVHDFEKQFAALEADLYPHMEKEEKVLFPMLEQLAAAEEQGSGAPRVHCGSVANPIRRMEHEHDAVAVILRALRSISDGYSTGPSSGDHPTCVTFKALMAGMAELEADLHKHIHAENSVLFPAGARLEQRLRDEGTCEKPEL